MLSKRIKHVSIRNYKSLAQVEVDLEDLTVLVGLNSSGKTNFLDALHLIRDGLAGSLDAAIYDRGGFENICFRDAKRKSSEISISLDLSIDGDLAVYAFSIIHYRDSYKVIDEKCTLGSTWYTVQSGVLKDASEKAIKREQVTNEKQLALPILRAGLKISEAKNS